jgi:hypothetical protein
MSIDQDEVRIGFLKDAHRLPIPYDSFVVYDREGYLGFRLLSHVGPTETGIEIDYADPFKLRSGESPIACYGALRIIGLPNRNEYKTKSERREDCGAKFVSWKRGSQKGLTEDVRAIICAAAARFKVELTDGYLMLAFYSETETLPALTPVDRQAYTFSGSVGNVSEAGARYLIEDIARLSPGLFSRNLPVGCEAGYTYEHNHEPMRVTTLVQFNGPYSAHEVMEIGLRYEQVVAATEALAPRRARMRLSSAARGVLLS